MKVAFAAADAGALPKSERVFAMVVTIAFESHSPGGQRLPRRRANFFCKGEQRAAQTKALPSAVALQSGSERPLRKKANRLSFCRALRGCAVVALCAMAGSEADSEAKRLRFSTTPAGRLLSYPASGMTAAV